MSGWQMPSIAQRNDKSMQLPGGDDTMNSFNVGKYNDTDVMDEIENMLEKRKGEKDLCRETTLYNMCDNVLEDLK